MPILDDVIKAALIAETTLQADTSNLEKLEAAAAVAAEPVPAAKAQVDTDAQAFNDSMDALANAAIAAKITIVKA